MIQAGFLYTTYWWSFTFKFCYLAVFFIITGDLFKNIILGKWASIKEFIGVLVFHSLFATGLRTTLPTNFSHTYLIFSSVYFTLFTLIKG